MLVHARQHDDLILFDCVKQRVREAAQDGTANFVLYALIQLGVVRQMRFGPFEFTKKRGRLAYLRLAVPPNCAGNLGSSGRFVANRIAHYAMPSLALISTSVTPTSSGCVRW